MELEEIKSLILELGLVRDITKTRDAWIAYGGLLAQCPYTQGKQVGDWVREQGLDFVARNQDRADAKTLFNLTLERNVKFEGCPAYTPDKVIRWLKKTGRIEVTRRSSRVAQAGSPDAPEMEHREVGEIESALEAGGAWAHRMHDAFHLATVGRSVMAPQMNDEQASEAFLDAASKAHFTGSVGARKTFSREEREVLFSVVHQLGKGRKTRLVTEVRVYLETDDGPSV